MNEGIPKQEGSDPQVERVTRFAEQEAVILHNAPSRRKKALMVMTLIGAMAMPAFAQAGEQREKGDNSKGRALLSALIEAAQSKAERRSTGSSVRRGVGAGVEQYQREKSIQRRREIAQEEHRARQSRAEAHTAERMMRDAEYKLRRIEGELPGIKQKVKVAQFEALKLAATDAEAGRVRTIMMERTGVKIELWKAGYNEDENRVEELAARDRELEESLLPHLGGTVAQRTGDLFVKTIVPLELALLDKEVQRNSLTEAMSSAGQALEDAMNRWEQHAERAQRGYDSANSGIRVRRY